MKKVNKKIDINAHVQNIAYQITSEGTRSVLTLEFENLGFGTITALKFEAKGYNAFGDVVVVNGKEAFFLIVQNIEVKENNKITDIKVILPNEEIRKLELVESQICYADGSVLSYEGKLIKEFELELYDDSYGEEKEFLYGLKDKFGSNFKYNPVECEEGWVCGCGRFNKERNNCSFCGNLKNEVFKYTSQTEKNNVIEYHKKEEAKRIQIEEQEKKKKIKVKAITTAVVLALVLLLILDNEIKVMSKRQTYSSVEEMKDDLQGTWWHYLEYTGGYGFEIDDNSYTFLYDDGEETSLNCEIKWKPSKGTFIVAGTKYVVLKGGNVIKEDDAEYSREDYIKKNEDPIKYSSSHDYGLSVKDIKVSSNSSYTICTGSVYNNSYKTYKFIKVKGAFKDSSGNVIDTDSGYAAGEEGLAPGESTTFRLSIDKKADVIDCDVSIYDYD